MFHAYESEISKVEPMSRDPYAPVIDASRRDLLEANRRDGGAPREGQARRLPPRARHPRRGGGEGREEGAVHVVTDDERREAARRLRGARYGWRSWERALYDALGVDLETAGLDMLDSLANLIEPSGHECVPGECPLNICHDNDRIDRDALLALAEEMTVEKGDIWGWSSRIREALGVRDDITDFAK